MYSLISKVIGKVGRTPIPILLAYLFASLALYLHKYYWGSVRLQIAGLIVQLLSFLVVALYKPGAAALTGQRGSWWKGNCAVLTIMAAYLLAFSATVFDAPTWSEELGWLEIAKSITQGKRWNPILFKSDYPSSFQAWPIALILAWTKNPLTASRLTGLLYASLSLYFLCAAVGVLIRAKTTPIFPALLGGLATMPLFYCHTGWHEVTSIPLLVFACWYCFLKVYLGKDKMFLRWFAISAGISFWTLYTPALAACILVAVFLFSGRTIFSAREKFIFILLLLIISGPVLAGVIKSHGGWLYRHRIFYMEDEATASALTSSPVERTALSLLKMGKHILPFQPYSNFDDYDQIRLEPTSFFLACIGAAAAVFYWRIQSGAALFLPLALLAVGIAASRPTVWRETALFAPLLLLTGVGIEALRQQAENRRWLSILLCGIVLIHLAVFSGRFASMHEMVTEKSHVRKAALVARRLHQCLEKDMQEKRMLYLPDAYSRAFYALVWENPPIHIHGFFRGAPRNSVVVVDNQSNPPSDGALQAFPVTQDGFSFSTCQVEEPRLELTVARSK